MQTDNKKPSQGSGKIHSSDMDWREKLDCILDPEGKGRDSDANMTEEEMDEWIDRYAPDDKKKGDKGEEEQERELNEGRFY